MKTKVLTLFVALIALTGCNSALNPLKPNAEPPIIALFSADATRIIYPQGTVIRWEVQDNSAQVRIDPYPGNVAAVGSALVTPINTLPINFTLTARNKYGTTQRFLTVVVN